MEGVKFWNHQFYLYGCKTYSYWFTPPSKNLNPPYVPFVMFCCLKVCEDVWKGDLFRIVVMFYWIILN